MRRALYWLMQWTTLLGAAFVIWLGCYISYHGFDRKWRQFVISEFRKRGIEVTMRRLTLDPWRGFVAREVKVMDPNARNTVLAHVDRIVLDINFANLLNGEPFLNAIGLSDARLALPLDPADKKSPRVEIGRLDALVRLPPHQWIVEHLAADLYGLHVSATGQINHPELWKSGRDRGDFKDSHRMFLDLVERVKKLRFEGAAPRIAVTFSGDAEEPAKIFGEASIIAEDVIQNGYRVRQLHAALTWKDGTLTLSRGTMRDRKGMLEATGTWTPLSGAAEFQLRSQLDLQAFAKAFNVTDKLDELVLYDPPLIDLIGRAELKHESQKSSAIPPRNLSVTGSIALGRFGYKSVLFDSFSAGFSLDGPRWYLRDVTLDHRSGKAWGHALRLPDDFRAKLLSTLNPAALLPLTSGKTAELLALCNFHQSPRAELAVHGPEPDFRKCVMSGAVELGRTEWRGVPLDRAAGRVRFANEAVAWEDFRVERSEGIGTGTFVYDFARHEARLENIKTSLIPTDVITWVEPKIVKHVAPYRCKAPPNCIINGVVHTKQGGKNTHLDIRVSAPEGMDYTFLKKNLSLRAVSGRLLFTEGRLRLSNLKGTLYGGRVNGEADISLRKIAPGYSARIEAADVDFASLTKLYFNYDTSQGALAGHFDFRGKGDDPKTLEGRGLIEVTDGDVFAIPLFGPLSGILNTIVPGMGYNVAREARSSFTIRDGVIATDDFVVRGHGFSMIGGGKLFFLDDKIDFSIRINAQGLPGVLLFPVSKLLEFTAESALSKPVWKPKRLPSL